MFKSEVANLIKPVVLIKLEKIKGKYGACVTLLSQDDKNGSGILKIEYSLDNGQTWNLYSGKLIFGKDGQYDIQFMATDRAGNIEIVKENEVNVGKDNVSAKEIKKNNRPASDKVKK
jgi:hypothetical protein